MQESGFSIVPLGTVIVSVAAPQLMLAETVCKETNEVGYACFGGEEMVS